MNKKELKNIVNEYVEKNYKEFFELKPKIKEIDTDIESFQKRLKIKAKPVKQKLYSFVYVKDEKPFKKILKLTVDENGSIIKVVASR
ncbi:MAG: hypothetical protein ABIN11_05955 [candidate division WOR-3 bacterium]